MAHWAEIDENNIVLRVLVGSNDDPDEGYQWLVNNLGGTWIKTSYNTRAGKRVNPETQELTEEIGFRGNYAAEGYVYDVDLDAFLPSKPFPSWILNKSTYNWDAPVEMPDSICAWSEKENNWIERPDSGMWNWDSENEIWIESI